MRITKKKPAKKSLSKVPKKSRQKDITELVTVTKTVAKYNIGVGLPYDNFKAKDWLELKSPIEAYCTKHKMPKTWQRLEERLSALQSALDVKDDKAKKKAHKALEEFFSKCSDKPKIAKLADLLPEYLEQQRKVKKIEVKDFVKKMFLEKYKELKKPHGFDSQSDFIQYLLSKED